MRDGAARALSQQRNVRAVYGRQTRAWFSRWRELFPHTWENFPLTLTD